ncbi:type VI secretion system contractile sheath large subunit [Burkholderia sp. AU42008]|nr:type VI secretion system contractile sheath large subunit [Burkholderia sp. AU32357]MBY4876393.1 type VI secretion system contractile sheath large subunit [Burkholderia sp. AU42008]OXI40674.1 EvpB family type VI secretion protein [Burkholderia sp. AU17457]
MSPGFPIDPYTKAVEMPDVHARVDANSATCARSDVLDWCLANLDEQLGRQLDAVLHHPAFQALESTWRGLKFLVDRTDFRQNVRIEVLDVSKEALHHDFDDAPDIIQSGLFRLTYVGEYDMPGGQPIAAIISAFEFDHRAPDIALLRNISKVAAAAHMPFIGAVSPAFFDKPSMEAVTGIRDLPTWFERAEYLKWKNFRETEDARYVALTMPRFLVRLPYGPDTTPVRAFNYTENVREAGRNAYLWTSAAFALAVNIMRSFVRNGWCVQIRGPQAGGLIEDIPMHRYDLGAGQLDKISTEALIPETRENEFADIGLIPLSTTGNHDQACFFSAHSTQHPRVFDPRGAAANSRINARLPYVFLLSRIAHYLKLIQRENIGTTRDSRLLELELNTWIKSLVTEMTDPGDDLQAAHPLREASVSVQDIEDNPGFFRIKLFIVPHFQVEGVDINLSLISQMPKAKQ